MDLNLTMLAQKGLEALDQNTLMMGGPVAQWITRLSTEHINVLGQHTLNN